MNSDAEVDEEILEFLNFLSKLWQHLECKVSLVSPFFSPCTRAPLRLMAPHYAVCGSWILDISHRWPLCPPHSKVLELPGVWSRCPDHSPGSLD